MEPLLIRAETRGKGDYGWLNTRYYFSFANYYNSKRVGFGKLLVINDDIIAPKYGFPTHGHSNMEIVTIVFEGELEHKDSMANIGKILPGEVQRMSAGKGVLHSEYNSSSKDFLKLFQIWVETNKLGVESDYEQKNLDFSKDKINLVISPDGRGSSLRINQNCYFSILNLDNDEKFAYEKYDSNNGIFVLVISGEILVSDYELKDRDAIGFYEIEKLEIKSKEKSQILIIEVDVKE